jgi:hydroxypyruvate isomerase
MSEAVRHTGRERSRPRVKGTMQYAHMLLQPRMMEMKAVTPFESVRSGAMSAYLTPLNYVAEQHLISKS